MIKTRTVFVLGAGASKPYGFPLGRELRDVLCMGAQGSNVPRMLKEHCGIQDYEAAAFADAFHGSGLNSIDTFLARRPDFVNIGKKAIAAFLCPLESENRVFNIENEDDWYLHIWNKMVVDVNKPQDLLSNQLRFITFNYDRSLEFFFFRTIKNTFNVDDHAALETVKKLDMLHVYGCLGAFHYDPAIADQVLVGARRYETAISGAILGAAANEIRVIPESRMDSIEFSKAREWLYWAKHIFFLGFGFDELNVARLRIHEIIQEQKNDHKKGLKVVSASVFKHTGAEVDWFRSIVGEPEVWYPLQHTNLMALRNSSMLR